MIVSGLILRRNKNRTKELPGGCEVAGFDGAIWVLIHSCLGGCAGGSRATFGDLRFL